MTMESSNDSFVRHKSCEKCGSSDALAVYDDGHGYCFACQTYFKEATSVETVSNVVSYTKPVEMYGTTQAIPDRKISESTARKFNVHSDEHSQYYPYYNEQGSLVGCKVREVATKTFRAQGDLRTNVMFGQHLFNTGGRYVTVVEGELDALAAYEMLGRYPVVSVSKGAAGAIKDFKKNLEWL